MNATAFWEWFQENEHEFFEMEAGGNEALFDKLAAVLSQVDENLTFEFSHIKDNGKREFILSANGIQKSFPAVFSLHETAPAFTNWEIAALKPRLENPEAVQLNLSGKIFGIEDIYFEYFPEEDCISLIIYLRADYPENVLAQIGFIFLDLLLGEYDVATKLGHIDFKPLDENKIKSMIPLMALRDIMDEKFPEE